MNKAWDFNGWTATRIFFVDLASDEPRPRAIVIATEVVCPVCQLHMRRVENAEVKTSFPPQYLWRCGCGFSDYVSDQSAFLKR